MDKKQGWYYCLEHQRVEPWEGCKAAARLGPYATQQEAQEAIETSRERNDAFDNDPRFNDPDEDEDEDS
ncbi:hypothetical protein [Parenemella sanctibonifatiensis]|uniref:SPOR domain-containing protein n=1 Tax=Parenemella sanctibonifatiensis TaxID=2016505 RepID=A0A255EDG9_9ACTN|nr:hypothetical protein [Parenemella sanctibonifatiensis]OYN89596.1 hypothetical protein CGZ92_02425 [Parenemella sanctibonifatiensis]